MYLKKLHITNFRCFKDYEVEFAPRVTVLFGKNGSGKSTLIHAIHKALSFVFKRNTSEEKGFDLTSGFSELKVEKYKKTDGVRDSKTGLLFPYVDINAYASFQDSELEWDMYASTSTFSLQTSKYKIAHKIVINKINETNTLPFFAYYSDSFPHIPKSKSITQQQMELRNLGYLDWNKESACSELWISRLKDKWTLWDRADRNVKHEENALRNCESMLKGNIISKEEYDENVLLHKEKLQKALTERGQYDEEISEIKSCLIKFSKGDSNYEVTDIFDSIYKEDGLCLETKQGDNPPFHFLPAGYKRMYYIVLDIAYRSYVLNKNTNPSGIVIIDEIDLHLHPELEKVVLGRFMDTFPNLQFIVSTHSPLVLTGIKTVDGQNQILKMLPHQTKPTPMFDIYGLDMQSGIQEVMDVNPNDEELNRWISRCAYMISKGYNEQAENLKNSILKKGVLSLEAIDKRISESLKMLG